MNNPDNSPLASLSLAEKKLELFRRQKDLLDTSLITPAE